MLCAMTMCCIPVLCACSERVLTRGCAPPQCVVMLELIRTVGGFSDAQLRAMPPRVAVAVVRRLTASAEFARGFNDDIQV